MHITQHQQPQQQDKNEKSAVKPTAETKKKFVHKRDGSGHLICEKCGFKPDPTPTHPKGNPSTMTYHLQKHDGNFTVKCSICKWTCLHKQTLDNHMATRHPETLKVKPTKYKCPVANCPYDTIKKADRRIHFVRKHCQEALAKYQKLMKVEDKEQPQFQCLCCQETYNSTTAIHYHLAGCWLKHQITVHDQLTAVC